MQRKVAARDRSPPLAVGEGLRVKPGAEFWGVDGGSPRGDSQHQDDAQSFDAGKGPTAQRPCCPGRIERDSYSCEVRCSPFSSSNQRARHPVPLLLEI